RRAASRGWVLPLVDGGRTREGCLPPVPGKGMSGQALVYRPLADGEVVCTSPRPALDNAGWRYRQRQESQAGRACIKRPSTLSVWGYAIGRWPGSESRQGGWKYYGANFGAHMKQGKVIVEAGKPLQFRDAVEYESPPSAEHQGAILIADALK